MTDNNDKSVVSLNESFSEEYNYIIDRINSVNGMIKNIQTTIMNTPQLTSLEVCATLESSYYALYKQYHRLAELTLQMSEMYKYVYLVNYANEEHHMKQSNSDIKKEGEQE